MTEPGGAPVTGKRPAVVAVVVRSGRVLVVKRGPQVARPGYWAPLSGRVEPGEPQPAAVVREVREEVGLEVRALAPVWECDTDDGSFRLYWWTAQITGGLLVPDPREVSEVRWVTPAQFAALSPTFADDHVFFDTILPTLGLT